MIQKKSEKTTLKKKISNTTIAKRTICRNEKKKMVGMMMSSCSDKKKTAEMTMSSCSGKRKKNSWKVLPWVQAQNERECETWESSARAF
jgi:hypothetical protein